MAHHAYAEPSGYPRLRPTAPHWMYRDSDLVGGAVVVNVDWANGPLHEDIDAKAAAGITELAPTPAKYLSPRSGGDRYYWDSSFPADAQGGHSTSGFWFSRIRSVSGRLQRATFDISCNLTVSASFPNAGIVVRGSDDTANLWRFICEGTALRLRKRVAGVETVVIEALGVITAGNTYTLRVTGSGNNFEIFLDGVSKGTATDSFNASAGDFGVHANSDANSRFHWFRCVKTETKPSGLTTYTVLDDEGQQIVTGSVTTDTITIPDASLVAANGNGSKGWFPMRLTGTDRADGQYGTAYGDCTIVRCPNHVGKFPALTLFTPNGDSGWQEAARSQIGVGPVRLQLKVDGTETAGALQTAQRMTTYWRSLDPGGRDARHTIGHFRLGIQANTAAVTSIVNTLKSEVKVWEGLNEPNGDGGYLTVGSVTTYITNELVPFYNAVKAADATAIVLAPNPVNVAPSIAWIDKFFELTSVMTPKPYDAVSVHVYNGGDGDLWLYDQTMIDLKAAMSNWGVSVPLWQTEQGNDAPLYGLFDPRRSARWESMRRFTQELRGLPIEHDVRWYDVAGGFDDVPFWWWTETGPAPIAALSRVMTAETWNKPLTSVLDFDDIYYLYRGGVFTDASTGDKVIGVIGCSPGLPAVRFSVTGATSLVHVDEWGNETTVTRSGGIVSMPTSDMPQWLRVPSGVTALLQTNAVNWGTNLALTATASTTGVTDRIAETNDGLHKNPYRYGVGVPEWIVSGGYNDNTGTLPQTETLTWGSPQTASKIVVKSFPAWQRFTSCWTDFAVQLHIGGVWTTVYTFADDPLNYQRTFTSKDWKSTIESYWPAQWAWVIDLGDTKIFDAARFVVNDASPGAHTSNTVSTLVWGATSVKNVTINDLEVYNAPNLNRMGLLR